MYFPLTKNTKKQYVAALSRVRIKKTSDERVSSISIKQGNIQIMIAT